MLIIMLFFALHRYSGKTQKQIVEFVRDNYVKRQTFQRYVPHASRLAPRCMTNSFSWPYEYSLYLGVARRF